MSSDLLQILCCPETRQSLGPANMEKLELINRLIRNRTCKNQGGIPVTEILDQALIREDGVLLYPVRNNIPLLLADEGIDCRNI